MAHLNFHFFALGAYGKGISGGDRIFIELSRRWSKKYPVTIYLWAEGYEMCKRQGLSGKKIYFKVSLMKPWRDFGFLINYIARIFEGIRRGLTLKLENSKDTVVYSASEFWMDSLPTFILKIRFPKITWIAAWFQTAPNPIKGFAEGKRENKYYLSALFYWLVQLPIKPFILKYADFVFINNKSEKKQFPKFAESERAIVVLGAVDLEKINEYVKKHKNIKKTYEAVFQGRFHPQKGVVELIQIWEKVVKEIPDARLAMVGDGPLMQNVKKEIENLGLEKNIILFGYLFDGEKKYQLFSQSKIVVHPAFYDSGGMASSEAMAFGSPVVGFNLKSYESYYPKGMVKVKTGDLDAFSRQVVRLLQDSKLRGKMAKEAISMIRKNWSWNTRSEEILLKIKNGRSRKRK